ncbi:cytochrome c oxidase subunit 2 [Pullulanibacillus pueri]|uniref:Cytochrome c oxidase subunit 2 n=1 Tax=Pullulanibacillus pueri TaxID=1437324 RepID=A0A8J2ZRG1_9BACL|nr:cytochrome c oxidase subunit II [Pullulanibacillus pueri]MBM7680098.1 cytochrome c oxidase subunit 2 [Pullulanibacillus pueri]GGH74358.1 cytochrome c oxidase subunit 2 [Pullulanibacillus pueri]
MKKNWQHVLRFLPLITLLALLSGCGKDGVSALEPFGEIAREQAKLMIISFSIMIIVVLVVGIIFTYVLVKFRKRKGQEEYIPRQVEGSAVLEIIWTVIPIILLAILAVPTVAKTFSTSDTTSKSVTKDAVVINVTANQFWWEFEYPDDKVVTAEDAVIPTGRNVIFNITSKDVTHSFWVPALGGKVDANPGQTTKLRLKADENGTYSGRCAELCGASHALMYFNVKAVSNDDYKAWINAMKDGASEPTTASAKEGQALFKNNCMSCHAVDSKDAGIAPNLENFADRKNIAGFLDHNKENLEKWIWDPQAEKPGALMPKRGVNNNLTKDQIKQIADYLFTLSVED